MRRSASTPLRWALAGAAAACLTAATASAFRFGDGPDRSGQPPAGPVRAHEERVVVLGDSVATGAGCDCKPFGPRLAALLTQRVHRPVHVSTLAKNGLTTAELLTQLRSDAETITELGTASAVTVTIAANDFDESQAGDSCPAGAGSAACYEPQLLALHPRLDELLRTLRRLTPPQAQILVTGYWNVFLDGVVGANEGATYERVSDALTQRVNETLRLSAKEIGATYVDLYTAFRGNGSADDTHLLADDGDHPSAAGQQRIAQALVGSLRTNASS